MDESFFQIVVYIIIAIVWFLFGGQKKKSAPKSKTPTKKQTEISDGQPTLADLLNKMKSNQEVEKEKGPEYYSSEIYGDPYKSQKKTSTSTSQQKSSRLKGYKKKKKNTYVEELLKDKESLRKAYIMSEIFKTKF